MLSRFTSFAKALMILSVASLLLAGCGGGQQAPTEPAAPEAPAVEPAVAYTEAQIQAQLAMADLVDGTEDKVVSKCTGCALQMDGKADHVVSLQGYSLHLCSDYCATHVKENPAKAIMAVKLPAEGEPEESGS